MNKLSIEQDTESRTNKTFMMGFFFILGVSSLSGWNAILTGMNFFDQKFLQMKSSFFLPIPNYIGLCSFGIIMPKLSGYLSVQFRIAGGLFFLSIFIVLLPIIAELIPNREGFYLDLIITIFLGISTCFVRSSSTGLASMYGSEYIAIFFVGNGFSGIFLCIFRFISLVAIDSSKAGLSILITLSFSAFLNVLAIAMFFIFKTTPQYKRGEILRKQNQLSIIQDIDTNDNSESLLSKQNKINQMGFLKTYWWINKLAFPIPLLVLILYCQTYMMFPGIALKKHFDPNFRELGVAIILLSFNIGDTLGRTIGGSRFYSQTCLIIFVIFRIIQFYPFILIADNIITNDIIAYLNAFSFAFIHGYITTGLMQLGPQKTNEEQIKEKIGFINGFSLYFGVLLGILFAIPVNEFYLKI